jgi:hypothetical protein
MAKDKATIKTGKPPAKHTKRAAEPAAARKTGRGAAPSAEAVPTPAPRTGNISAELMKKTIAFFYLLAFCPPEKLGAFIRITAPLRARLAAGAGMEPGAYFAGAVPEVCRRIVAFHQATREPDARTAASLAEAMGKADQSPERLAAFQARMGEIAALPARANTPNRLLQDKGCRRCAAPCRYGFFVLMSNPQFARLQELMAEETVKPASGQSPLIPAQGFAVSHILDLIGAEEGFLQIEDLANLSFCLLVWGMGRSRVPLPENYLRLFQTANQEFIRRSQAIPAA